MRPHQLLSVTSLASALGLLACAANPPRDTAARPSLDAALADSLAPTDAPAAEAAPAPRPDRVEQLRARLGLHRAPVEVRRSNPREASGTLVFTGDAETARDLYWVGDAPGVPPARIERWPTGVRVVDVVLEGEEAWVLLESLAALDQPAGLRTFLPLRVPRNRPSDPSAPGASVLELRETPPALRSAHDRASLGVLRARAPQEAERGTEAQCAAYRRALETRSGTPTWVAAGGLDLVTMYQPGVWGVEHLEAAQVAAHPRREELVRVLLQLARQDDAGCYLGQNTAYGEGESKQSVVRLVGGRIVVEAAFLTAAAPPRATSAPRVVPATTGAPRVREALARRLLEVPATVFEAPLDAAGRDALGYADDGSHAWLVLLEGSTERLLTLAGAYFPGGAPQAVEARFADVDGDGRTDLLLAQRWSDEGTEGASPLRVRVWRSPWATMSTELLAPYGVRQSESDSAFLISVRDAEEAARRAASLPTRALSAATACGLLRGLRRTALFRQRATPDAVVLGFEQPEWPTFRPGVTAVSAAAATERLDAALRYLNCTGLECEADRPFCRHHPAPGPGSTFLWFDTTGRAPRVAGIALYEGE